MHRIGQMRAFTLVELMVGLMVTSILLSAVATLAFAMSSASTAGGDSALRQAHLRNATVRLSELISNCKMACVVSGQDLAIWTADRNNDSMVNVNVNVTDNELIYVEYKGADRKLQLRLLKPLINRTYTIDKLALPTTKTQVLNLSYSTTVLLIDDCNDAQFVPLDALSLRTRLLAIRFQTMEDGAYQWHEIVAGVRCRADYLFSASGEVILTGDDD